MLHIYIYIYDISSLRVNPFQSTVTPHPTPFEGVNVLNKTANDETMKRELKTWREKWIMGNKRHTKHGNM